MMHGWTGRILKIDLSSQKTEIIELQQDSYIQYIGGKGLGGQFLKPHITKDWNHEEMPLLFFAGPLVGTPSPTSGRMTVISRSPLTGTVGDASVGGSAGTMLKKAGFDGIIITGKSDTNLGISINDNSVEFYSAKDLQMSQTSEIYESLKNKGSVLSTGPAAESGVLFASVAVDGHFSAGRNGLGLVMASKNLKYITISGSGTVDIFNRDILMDAREKIFRLASASPILKGELGIGEYGTGALYDLMDSRRMMPTDNFRQTFYESAPSMNAWHYKETYETKKFGCKGCHILCKKKAKDSRVIPEFETMSHFSALLCNVDSNIVMEANRICNEAGMDTISAAVTLGCYKEISGCQISGNDILSLLKDISLSENAGEELKLGSYRYSELNNRIETSMTVKKMELPAYDPRGAYGMALAYATSTRGGCHLRAYPISHEILRKPVATDRFSFSGKARIIKMAEDMNAVIDSLTACKFIFFGASLEEYSQAFFGVTGVDLSAQDLLKTGERIYINDRWMNDKNGFSAKDDDLPERFFDEPGTSGNGIEVGPVPRDEFLEARNNYYKIRHLDADGRVDNKTKEVFNLNDTDPQ
ncbi:MAG: hypothetical protein PF450_05310 [Bacteroidales bacterium]|jgi:aldehyde:ferredoxin oxidoreductase|nr:hypothetical protein [Bacteroidales bacterium]